MSSYYVPPEALDGLAKLHLETADQRDAERTPPLYVMAMRLTGASRLSNDDDATGVRIAVPVMSGLIGSIEDYRTTMRRDSHATDAAKAQAATDLIEALQRVIRDAGPEYCAKAGLS